MAKLIANNGDPDQTPRFAASDLDQHCLQITHLGISRLQWIKRPETKMAQIETTQSINSVCHNNPLPNRPKLKKKKNMFMN